MKLKRPPSLCPGCGSVVKQSPGPGRPRIHCSDRCRWRVDKAAWRKAHPLGWRLVPDQPNVLEMMREAGYLRDDPWA